MNHFSILDTQEDWFSSILFCARILFYLNIVVRRPSVVASKWKKLRTKEEYRTERVNSEIEIKWSAAEASRRFIHQSSSIIIIVNKKRLIVNVCVCVNWQLIWTEKQQHRSHKAHQIDRSPLYFDIRLILQTKLDNSREKVRHILLAAYINLFSYIYI